MDRPAQPMKPDRSTLWPIIIVAGVLAICVIAGVRMLVSTRAAWERNQAPSANQIIAQRIDAKQTRDIEVDREIALREQRLEEIRKARSRQAAPFIAPPEGTKTETLRCIGGQLFRKLPNGWENIPGERC